LDNNFIVGFIEPDFIESSASALLLHSFFNGIESIVLMILKNIGKIFQAVFNGIKNCLKKHLRQLTKEQ
jgi:hypothetical protein